MTDLVSFFTAHKHSIFIPFKYLYPECLVLIDKGEKLSPLLCLKDSCPVNANCPSRLAKRVKFLFDHVAPESKMIYAYFKYRDRPNSIRAGVFDRELNEPRVITLNKSAFEKFKKEGVIHQWNPPMDYWLLGGSDKLIPVENLLVKP